VTLRFAQDLSSAEDDNAIVPDVETVSEGSNDSVYILNLSLSQPLPSGAVVVPIYSLPIKVSQSPQLPSSGRVSANRAIGQP
jgi:hypothetical protein